MLQTYQYKSTLELNHRVDQLYDSKYCLYNIIIIRTSYRLWQSFLFIYYFLYDLLFVMSDKHKLCT